jgi:RNA polymerase sigma factor (sigma-70 family)
VFGRDPFAHPELLIRRVYAYVAYRIGDGPDAEDVTSETFERGLRYRGSYDAAKGDAVSWLIGIARRVISDSLASRRDPVGESAETVSSQDVEARTLRRVALQDALAQLDEADRELIALRYGADLTTAQIADLWNLRPNTIDVRIHRALERLRARLEAEGSAERGAAASDLQTEP